MGCNCKKRHVAPVSPPPPPPPAPTTAPPIKITIKEGIPNPPQPLYPPDREVNRIVEKLNAIRE